MLFDRSRLMPAPHVHHVHFTLQYKLFVYSSLTFSHTHAHISFCNVAHRSGADIEKKGQTMTVSAVTWSPKAEDAKGKH
jgi:hypothetical protein